MQLFHVYTREPGAPTKKTWFSRMGDAKTFAKDRKLPIEVADYTAAEMAELLNGLEEERLREK